MSSVKEVRETYEDYIKMIKMNHEREMREALNRVASCVAVYYADVMSVKEEEAEAEGELCAILLASYKNLFKELAREGVDVAEAAQKKGFM